MSNKDLLDASEKGDLKAVKSLLANNKIDINCKDILIQNISLYSNLTFLIIFKFIAIFKIEVNI